MGDELFGGAGVAEGQRALDGLGGELAAALGHRLAQPPHRRLLVVAVFRLQMAEGGTRALGGQHDVEAAQHLGHPAGSGLAADDADANGDLIVEAAGQQDLKAVDFAPFDQPVHGLILAAGRQAAIHGQTFDADDKLALEIEIGEGGPEVERDSQPLDLLCCKHER
jgi:hypothetical protein